MPNGKVSKSSGAKRGSKPTGKAASKPGDDARRSKPAKRATTGRKKIKEPVGPAEAETIKHESSASDHPHIGIANRYIADVLSGAIPACKWVRAACQRQIDDLHKSANDPAYPYRFDAETAERWCIFIELCPHIKGPLRGQLIQLEPWQSFCITTVFGWLSRFTKKRRFRESYIEVPSGNGKSALSSPVALGMLSIDGEGGAEVYCAATTRDQAKIVFFVAQEMARAMPDFRERFGIEVAAHSINQTDTASWIRPLSSDANSGEGINIHCAIVDEFHAHRTRDLYDMLKNHMGKRDQPLIWEITTAGSDRSGVCYAEVRSYLTKILGGAAKDDRFWGIIYGIDDDDDWGDPASWRKANPNWGVSVFPDAIAAEAHQALQLASKQPAFQNKHLDVWTNSDFPFMDMRRFCACADVSLREEDFIGQQCCIGIDLANKLDILATVKLFWRDPETADGKRHYYTFGTYWLPKAQIEQAQNSQYRGWAIEGRIRTCPGETNDYDLVEAYLREEARRFDVRQVGHDPWNAQQIVNHLMADGLTMVQVDQNVKNLSEPMKEIEAAVYDGRFHFNGDPILIWAMGNVRCKPDKNDNIFPTKEHFADKIDPVSALNNAMNRVMSIAAADGGGGVSVFGNCAKCGALCEGSKVKGQLMFDCGKHGRA